VCINEGEELLVELAERIDAGADYADVRDLWLKPGRDGHQEPRPRPLLRPRDVAIPDFEPFRTVHINDDQIRPATCTRSRSARSIPIMTQRGCPFSCSFCIESVYQDMFGKKNSLRRRSWTSSSRSSSR